jgi:hypothetical protein
MYFELIDFPFFFTILCPHLIEKMYGGSMGVGGTHEPKVRVNLFYIYLSISKLIIRFENAMVRKPWYIKKPN